MVAVMVELERLDKGRAVPNLSGSYGAFFYRYAEQRTEIVEFAMNGGLTDIRRDGAVTCASLDGVTLFPLIPDDDNAAVETAFGKLVLRAYCCPELLATITLRLWLSAASAREMYREILYAKASSLEVRGDLRWLPPSVATAGTTECRTLSQSPTFGWQSLPYMKATGDDVNALPHALDYVQLNVGNRGVLGHVRTFVGRVGTDGRLEVPSIIRDRSAAVSFSTQGSLRPGRVVLCLAYKEPGEQRWTLISAQDADANQSYSHFRLWSLYREFLLGDPGLAAPLEMNCRQAVRLLGIGEPNCTDVPFSTPDVSGSQLRTFIGGAARLLRFGPKPNDEGAARRL